MNHDFFARVVARIESDPVHWHQEYFEVRPVDGERFAELKAKQPEICGTSHCIAGWAIRLEMEDNGAEGSIFAWSVPRRTYPATIRDYAGNLLSLTIEEAEHLFFNFHYTLDDLRDIRDGKISIRDASTRANARHLQARFSDSPSLES